MPSPAPTRAIPSALAAILVMAAWPSTLPGQARGGAEYVEPVTREAAFDHGSISMLASEMETYANNLVAVACEDILAKYLSDEEGEIRQVPPAKMLRVRKLVGTALHLAPRSRHAVVANALLKERRLPSPNRERMSADGFASLMVTRANVLRKEGGEENKRIGALLLELATYVDPENEDAIYAFEILRLDGHENDWRPILGDAE